MAFVPRLADFEGTWRIARAIGDRLGGTPGRFEGVAVFRAGQGGLAYREEGILRFGDGAAMTATRDYVWQEADGRIRVSYADGRPFHEFDPSDPAARHLCDPDDYRVRYDFARWPEWRAEWVVNGPRKDYTMISTYVRAG